MEEKIYFVKSIEGEYAVLAQDNGEEVFIAMSLLPHGIDVGTKLKSFMFQYEIIE